MTGSAPRRPSSWRPRGGAWPPGARERRVGRAGPDHSADEREVVFANWPDYIDAAGHPGSDDGTTLDDFTRQTGVTVRYQEVIKDNNDWYTRIEPSLRAGRDTGYDLMVLGDYMISKCRHHDFLQELDLTRIPRHCLLMTDSLGDPVDPGRRFSVPWARGYTTIAYNRTLVERPVTRLKDLFTRFDLHGMVTLFVEMDDTIGLAMLALGLNPEHFTDAQFSRALEFVRRARESGQVRRFAGSDYLRDFERGATAAGMTYSGDISQLGDSRLVVVHEPLEGMLTWSDNMVIPNMARHKANAEELINHYLDPSVAARLDHYIGYPPSVKGAAAALERLDPRSAAGPLLNPTPTMRAAARGFMSLSVDQLDDYTGRFQEMINA